MLDNIKCEFPCQAAEALRSIIQLIEDYVESLSMAVSPELKEIELELLSALTNDNALHIEEIMVLLDSFEMEEIRAKIDEIFDEVTVNLVGCGQKCLARLTQVVMADIEEPLEQVFTIDWLEGNQVDVAVATVGDYMRDFDEFLMNFWSAKFVANILEAIILRYARAVVFKKGGPKIRSIMDDEDEKHSSGNGGRDEAEEDEVGGEVEEEEEEEEEVDTSKRTWGMFFQQKASK